MYEARAYPSTASNSFSRRMAPRLYRRLETRKNRGVAKVAVARKLATRLDLMFREGWTYAQLNQAVMLVSRSHSVAGKQEPNT